MDDSITFPFVSEAGAITVGFARPIPTLGDTTSFPLNVNAVTAFQGRPVSPSAPTAADTMAWNGHEWAPGGMRVFSVAAFNARGDGINNDSQYIKAADTAAAATGGVLYFPPGTYLCSGLILASRYIQGHNATLKLASGGTILLNGLAPNNTTVRDLTFDLNNQAGTTIGLSLNAGTGLEVSGCTFKNGVYGIRSNGVNVSNLKVHDNEFQTNAGVLINNGVNDTIIITSNRFKGGAAASQVGPGINLNITASTGASITKFVIADNLIDGYYTTDNTSGFGVCLAGSTLAAASTLTDGLVSNNTIVNCVGDSIHVEGSCHDVTITGNAINNGSANGILILNSGTQSPFIFNVSNNTVTACGSTFGSGGIAFTGAGAGVAGEVLINGNVVRGCGRAGAATFYGIMSLGGGKNVISDNIVVNTIGVANAGIQATDAVSVINNRCYDDGAATQQYGFNAAGTGAVIDVIGNNFAGNTTGTILWSSTAAMSGRSMLADAGAPNTVVPANPGALYTDTTNGNVWIKNNGTAKTGWDQLADLTTTTTQSFAGGVLSSNTTSGIGYATGVGGSVTQSTSRTTGVALNKLCGKIVLVSAAGSATWNTFTVTNTTVAATDVVICEQATGANTYNVIVSAVAAGSFKVSVSAVVGTATEAPALNFAVIKAVQA